MSTVKEVDRKQFENENTEENLTKKTPVEGVNMEEDKKETGEDKEDEDEQIMLFY